MDALNIVTSVRGLVKDEIAEIHTSLPVRVTGVDYGSKTVTLESIVKNTRSTEDEVAYPTFYDVPFMVNGGGTARISFPIKAGDIGTVIFSERDPSNALQTSGEDATGATILQPCGLYPICFIPKIATATDSSEPVDDQKIVISNNKNTYAEFDPTDKITIRNSAGMIIEISESGVNVTAPGKTIKMSDGSGQFTMSGGNLSFKGGNINLNGLVIDSSGNMTDGNGVGFHTHTHKVRNVQSGNSERESDKPTGE